MSGVKGMKPSIQYEDGRRCTVCEIRKLWSDYNRDKLQKSGFSCECRKCVSLRHRNKQAYLASHVPIDYLFPKMISEYKPTKITKAEWFDWVGYSERSLVNHIRRTLGYTTWYHAAISRYHLDHLKPRWLFDIEYFGDEEFKACWALKNLRLVPREVNYRKTSLWTDEDGKVHVARTKKRYEERLVA